ncbi:MAG: EAL domain-containing protein [Acidithiobacillus ferriphilus]
MSHLYRLEPIVDLLTGDVVGQELLAGKDFCPVWNDIEWRDWYLFLAKEIPLLLTDLQGDAPGKGLLFLNLHGHQLLDLEIIGNVHTLKDHAEHIVIEWTEQRFHDESMPDVMEALNDLKRLGFKVAIDDIGAGHGVDGLGRAGVVKAHFCKIDGPYFQATRDKGPEYLRDLCRHLSHGGARVIVEWVETDSDYRLALAAGAHLGQGYLWTKAPQTAVPLQGAVLAEQGVG